MSTPKQALADLQKNKFWPAYFLYGEELFKVHEFVEKAKVSFFSLKEGESLSSTDSAFKMDVLEGASSRGVDVLNSIESLGLFGGGDSKKLILVKQAELLKETDALLKKIDEASTGENLLIFISTQLDARKKFHQMLKRKGYALEFKAVRDAEFSQWVTYLAQKRKAQVHPEVIPYLAVLTDYSLFQVDSEIEKAWLYASAKNEGKKDLVLDLQCFSSAGAITGSFQLADLVEAILLKKKLRSMLLTQKMVKTTEEALSLVGFLNWSIKNQALPSRQSLHQTDLDRASFLSELVGLESRLKSSPLEPESVVESFILKFCET